MPIELQTTKAGTVSVAIRNKDQEAAYQAALQKIVNTLTLKNLEAVAEKCNKHGVDKMNAKLQQGLKFL